MPAGLFNAFNNAPMYGAYNAAVRLQAPPQQPVEGVVPAGDGPALPEQAGPANENVPNRNRTCVVCLLEPATQCVIPCGHYCLCLTCSNRIEDSCPLCRQNFTAIVTVY